MSCIRCSVGLTTENGSKDQLTYPLTSDSSHDMLASSHWMRPVMEKANDGLGGDESRHDESETFELGFVGCTNCPVPLAYFHPFASLTWINKG